ACRLMVKSRANCVAVRGLRRASVLSKRRRFASARAMNTPASASGMGFDRRVFAQAPEHVFPTADIVLELGLAHVLRQALETAFGDGNARAIRDALQGEHDQGLARVRRGHLPAVTEAVHGLDQGNLAGAAPGESQRLADGQPGKADGLKPFGDYFR